MKPSDLKDSRAARTREDSVRPFDREDGQQMGSDASFQAALQSALERKPDVRPSGDFARRVATLAAAQPVSHPFLIERYARATAFVAAALVVVTLFLLAPRSAASFGNLVFDLEMVFLTQLAMLAWWLSRHSSQGR